MCLWLVWEFLEILSKVVDSFFFSLSMRGSCHHYRIGRDRRCYFRGEMGDRRRQILGRVRLDLRPTDFEDIIGWERGKWSVLIRRPRNGPQRGYQKEWTDQLLTPQWMSVKVETRGERNRVRGRLEVELDENGDVRLR